jgi:hypothetical protein
MWAASYDASGWACAAAPVAASTTGKVKRPCIDVSGLSERLGRETVVRELLSVPQLVAPLAWSVDRPANIDEVSPADERHPRSHQTGPPRVRSCDKTQRVTSAA